VETQHPYGNHQTEDYESLVGALSGRLPRNDDDDKSEQENSDSDSKNENKAIKQASRGYSVQFVTGLKDAQGGPMESVGQFDGLLFDLCDLFCGFNLSCGCRPAQMFVCRVAEFRRIWSALLGCLSNQLDHLLDGRLRPDWT
jgi:hypothetical protein